MQTLSFRADCPRVPVGRGRYPELIGRLVAREVERSRNLGINMAIVGHARVDVRIHMLLWHFVDRWGYARPEGTMLPLPLTHEVLAELVAARRPTVSTALARLANTHLVHAKKDGWLLLGEPPRALPEGYCRHYLRDASFVRYLTDLVGRAPQC